MEGVDLPRGHGVRDKPQSRGSSRVVRELWKPVDTAEPIRLLLVEEVSRQSVLPRRHCRSIEREKEGEKEKKGKGPKEDKEEGRCVDVHGVSIPISL